MDAAALSTDIISNALDVRAEAAAADAVLWARSLSAQALADDVRPRLGVFADEAFVSLCHIPDSSLPMLDSPQGWAGLANYIAADLGAPALTYLGAVSPLRTGLHLADLGS